METLTEEQQKMYAELTPSQQKIVDSAPQAQKGIVIESMWAGNNADQIVGGGTQPPSTPTASGSSGIGASNLEWKPDQNTAGQPADLSQSYAQGAIGVAGQRRLQIFQKAGGGLKPSRFPAVTQVFSHAFKAHLMAQCPQTSATSMGTNTKSPISNQKK